MNFARRLLTVAGPALLALACADSPAERTASKPVRAAEPLPITTDSPEALTAFEAGRAKLEVGRAMEARELLARAIELDPSFTFAYLGLAEASFSAQEFKQNLDLALDSVAGKSDAERILVDISRTYLTNDSDERLALSRRLTQRYPNSPRSWQALGYTLFSRAEHVASREAFDRAIELDPGFLGGYLGLWNSYLFAEPKDFARSREAMEAALEIAEDEAQLYQNLGDTYRAMNDLETARSYYGQAIERDGSGSVASVASLKKGHINSFLGHFEEARADYDKGVEGSDTPNKAQYANYRAFTHLHAEDPAAAIAELEEVLAWTDELDLPEDQRLAARTFTLGSAAQIALHVGLLEQAEELVALLAETMRAYASRVGDPDFERRQAAEILIWKGQLRARSGDSEGALKAANEIRELMAGDANPRGLEAFHGLSGLVALLDGDYESAVVHLEQSDLMKAYVKYHLALAQEGAGRTDEARALFREVAEWNFNSVGFALVRRDALRRAG